MSEMEHNKGKLIPFNLTEEVAKTLVEAKGDDDGGYDSYLEQVEDDYTWFDENLCKIAGKWYKVEFEIKSGELYGFAYVDENEDGSINFDTYHYNGGGHWTEVVEGALK
jgi:hypothetical protein